jgi:hypothetical protein
MSKNASHRWDDAVVAQCLLAASRGELRAICAEHPGLTLNMAQSWRARKQKRAVRIADRLGLPHRDPFSSTWDERGR